MLSAFTPTPLESSAVRMNLYPSPSGTISMKLHISPVMLSLAELAFFMPSQYTSSVQTFFMKAAAVSSSFWASGCTVTSMAALASTTVASPSPLGLSSISIVMVTLLASRPGSGRYVSTRAALYTSVELITSSLLLVIFIGVYLPSKSLL